MKKKRYVIKNQPVKIPLFTTLFILHLLDYYQVNGVVWGVGITLLVLWWLIVLVGLSTEESVDIFDSQDLRKVSKDRSSLADKIKEWNDKGKNN